MEQTGPGGSDPAADTLQAHLLPDEQVLATFELRREGRLGSIGTLGLTNLRLLVYDRYFADQLMPVWTSIPYTHVRAATLVQPETGVAIDPFGRLVITTGAGSHRWLLATPEAAQLAHRLVTQSLAHHTHSSRAVG